MLELLDDARTIHYGSYWPYTSDARFVGDGSPLLKLAVALTREAAQRLISEQAASLFGSVPIGQTEVEGQEAAVREPGINQEPDSHWRCVCGQDDWQWIQ